MISSSLFVLKSLFSLTLQKVDSDLTEACPNVENIADVVKKWSINAKQEFSQYIFNILESVNSEIVPQHAQCIVLNTIQYGRGVLQNVPIHICLGRL